MRLLLVEDEPRIVELLTQAFKRLNFAVDAVFTALRAKELLEAVAYDATILDLGLEDGDGLEVLAAARARGLTTPVSFYASRAWTASTWTSQAMSIWRRSSASRSSISHRTQWARSVR